MTSLAPTTESRRRKAWQTPRLRVHGSLEQLTLTNKKLGPSDGLFLMGIGPIGDGNCGCS